ncbi:MAG: N-acetylmuramoyl-L-alanine amidase [Dethiobacter sp.]|nr:MAG: N-acetylmuramoyl-L-alanine amidase [Dethiobacter sp.]
MVFPQIIEDFIPSGRPNRSSLKLSGPKWITVHDTANTRAGADALAHARYLKGDEAAKLPVSWHFTVDDKQIVQHLPLNEVGWHAGDGLNGPGNRSSIGIEICENQDGNRQKAEANAAWLVADLLQKFGLDINQVVQHNRWSGKNCPRVLRGRLNGWDQFLTAVKQNLGENIFPDVPANHWAAEGIRFVKDNRLMAGKSDGKFYPDEPLTRAQTAVVLRRFYLFLLKKPYTNKSLKKKDKKKRRIDPNAYHNLSE